MERVDLSGLWAVDLVGVGRTGLGLARGSALESGLVRTAEVLGPRWPVDVLSARCHPASGARASAGWRGPGPPGGLWCTRAG